MPGPIAEELSRSTQRMNATATPRCYMIGLEANEIEWVRLLVKLLRGANPLAPELARQALAYVQNVALAASPESGIRPVAQC